MLGKKILKGVKKRGNQDKKGEIKRKRGKKGKKLSETSHPLCNNSVGNDFRLK